MKTEQVVEDFHKHWDVELRRVGPAKASLWRVLYNANRKEVLWTLTMLTFWIVFFLLTPAFFIRRLIQYVAGDEALWVGILLAIGVATRSGGGLLQTWRMYALITQGTFFLGG